MSYLYFCKRYMEMGSRLKLLWT